jgi:hypothetical protein
VARNRRTAPTLQQQNSDTARRVFDLTIPRAAVKHPPMFCARQRL